MSRVPRRNQDSDTFNSYRNDLDSRERRDWSPEWGMSDRDGGFRDRDRDREGRNRLDPYYADGARRQFRNDWDDDRDTPNRREWNERRDRAPFGQMRNWRDQAEDNWTGRSRGDEYRQEDFESFGRYQRPDRMNDFREGRDSERWGYGRQSMASGQDLRRSYGPGFDDRGEFSPMNRYGADYGRQSFQGIGYNQPRERNLAGVGPKNWKRSDERIKEDVCEAIAAHPEIDASDTDITVKDAVVTLSGTVSDRRTRRVMEDVVDSIPGVADVECQLKVETKSTKAGMLGNGDKAHEKDRTEKTLDHAKSR